MTPAATLRAGPPALLVFGTAGHQPLEIAVAASCHNSQQRHRRQHDPKDDRTPVPCAGRQHFFLLSRWARVGQEGRLPLWLLSRCVRQQRPVIDGGCGAASHPACRTCCLEVQLYACVSALTAGGVDHDRTLAPACATNTHAAASAAFRPHARRACCSPASPTRQLAREELAAVRARVTCHQPLAAGRLARLASFRMLWQLQPCMQFAAAVHSQKDVEPAVIEAVRPFARRRQVYLDTCTDYNCKL